MRHWAVLLAVGLVVVAMGWANSAEKGGKDMQFKLTSTAFKEGEYIPAKYTGEGKDVSPPLKWTDPPEGTKSFALIADDPDAPMGTWVHWVAWGIKPDVRELPEGVPTSKTVDGMKQGTTNFNKTGYGGPMPPKGSDHRYYFKLYALDAELDVQPGAKKADLVKAMEGHILAQTQLMGRYKR